MSRSYGTYKQYLGEKICCEFNLLSNAGSIGPTGDAAVGLQGYTGPTGSQGKLGYTGPSRRGDTGPAGPADKSFIIEHPDDKNKYLVHVCLEGPEAAVYYRGKGEITNNESVTIFLPDYVTNMAYDFSTSITSIYDDKIKTYNCSRVENNSFTVYGENGKFYWIVHGKRHDIDVEPHKEEISIQGDGPYLWS